MKKSRDILHCEMNTMTASCFCLFICLISNLQEFVEHVDTRIFIYLYIYIYVEDVFIHYFVLVY